ncbi:MAG: ferrous iron transport protein B [Methanimicrococcus sp.]|nr:ferrous iron transport protein B [Methanimicrococcus sp.]
MTEQAKYTVALAGNPNSGKTTLFNRLTKSNQRVGNWPGVTIEKKVGSYAMESPNAAGAKVTVHVVDLPGIYSLTPYSEEEIIARNFIVDENPDLIINIIDGTNLERNLYLTFQLKKLGCPMIAALNMMDEVEQNNTEIDFEKMAGMLGIPVIPISALEGKSLSAKAAKLAGYRSSKAAEGGVERLISKAGEILNRGRECFDDGGDVYTSRRTEETEEDRGEGVEKKKFDPALLKKAETIDYDAHSAEIYERIEKIISASVHEGERSVQQERTKKIDAVLTNKWLGLPIFLVLMLAVFQISFGAAGSFFSGLIDAGFNGLLAGFIESRFASAGASAWMTGLVVHGVIAGVGGILVFIPQLVLLFTFLTLLEDTGYMARAAFLMDRIFYKFGLSGKSFIPMLLGFGCSVPAVMAARAVDNEADRKVTIFITPFMSCGARLPIYVLFIGTFFAAHQGLIMLSLYVLGIIAAVVSAWLLKKTVFQGPQCPFIMELPPYRFPDLYTYLRHVWEKTRGFIIRAGTIIFVMSIVIWFVQGYDFSLTAVDDTSQSILGLFGTVIAPFFAPLGFGDWRAAVTLLTGFITKEAMVSTINILFTEAEFEALFTLPAAYAFTVFTLLYLPCVAAFSAIRRELGSWKWALAAAAYQTAAAYAAAFLVYRLGLLLLLYL